MSSSKGLFLVALACMLSTACVMEVDEPEGGEAIGIVDQDLGTADKFEQDGEESIRHSDTTSPSCSDRELLDALLDPDPVSWKPPPRPGPEDNGSSSADKD